MKLNILIKLAKSMDQFHQNAMSHGSLTSFNVFVSVPEDPRQIEDKLVVQVDGIELVDFKKFANIFFSYRNSSVWSAPEVLKQPKKVLDPLPQFDVYSFGLIMWEVFH